MKKFICIIATFIIVISYTTISFAKEKKNAAKIDFSGLVIDGPLLTKGGKLGLMPFKAGPLAEANDELDRVSANIIKGIKQALESQPSSLTLIDATEGKPEIVLEGYVQELTKKGGIGTMMSGKRGTLVLEGNLWLVANGHQLLQFRVSKKFLIKKEDINEIASAMGIEIGRYILSKTNTKEEI